jgi:hypothetical protein
MQDKIDYGDEEAKQEEALQAVEKVIAKIEI